jgi:prepilin-type processing-associated H-X9-DG protein
MIDPYVKSTQLFRCPSNPNNRRGTDGGDPFNRSYNANGISDPTNLCGTAPMPEIDVNKPGVHLGRIDSPAELLLIMEGREGYAEMRIGDEMFNSDGGKGDFFAGHLGTTTFLFADGHVKSLKPTATVTPKNMWNLEDTGDGCAALLTRLRNVEQNPINQ